MLTPGISGGSMSIIWGIYDKLMSAVNSFIEEKKKYNIPAYFFSWGYAGMLLSANPSFELIKWFLNPMMYFFIGVVLGGFCKKTQIKEFHWKYYIILL